MRRSGRAAPNVGKGQALLEQATYGDGGSVLARSSFEDGEDVLGEEGVRLAQPDHDADDELPFQSQQLPQIMCGK